MSRNTGTRRVLPPCRASSVLNEVDQRDCQDDDDHQGEKPAKPPQLLRRNHREIDSATFAIWSFVIRYRATSPTLLGHVCRITSAVRLRTIGETSNMF